MTDIYSPPQDNSWNNHTRENSNLTLSEDKLSKTEPQFPFFEAMLNNASVSKNFIDSCRSLVLDSDSLPLFLSFCDSLDHHFKTPSEQNSENDPYSYKSSGQVLSFYNSKNFIVQQISKDTLKTEDLLFIFKKYPYLEPKDYDLVDWFDTVRHSKLENKNSLLSIQWPEFDKYDFLKDLKNFFEHLRDHTYIEPELMARALKAKEQYRIARDYNAQNQSYEANKNLNNKYETLQHTSFDEICFNPHPQTFEALKILNIKPEAYFSSIEDKFILNKIISTVKSIIHTTDLKPHVQSLSLYESNPFYYAFLDMLMSQQEERGVVDKLHKVGLQEDKSHSYDGVEGIHIFTEHNKKRPPPPMNSDSYRRIGEAVLYLRYAFDFSSKDINAFFDLFADNFKHLCSTKDKLNTQPDYKFLDCFFEEIRPQISTEDKRITHWTPGFFLRLEDLSSEYEKEKLEQNISLQQAGSKRNFKI